MLPSKKCIKISTINAPPYNRPVDVRMWNNIGVLEIVGPNKDVARKICAVAFNLVIFLDAFKTVINLFWEGFIS